MEAIGIDLGSYKAVMAVVKKGGIDIVLNDASNRQTPVQIAYTENERIIGDSVKFQHKKNFKNTILFPTRLMGLNSECKSQIALEERFSTHKIVEMENKKIGFECVQMGQKYTFTVEQVIAFFLVKLKKYFEKANIKSKDIVLSAPSYCSNVERQCLLDACEIAGLNCLRIINESTAIALQYGFFRKKELDAKEAKIVAFVDFGHSKTTVTIASFIQGKTKIICHKSDRNLGARDFDWEILQNIGGEFSKKVGADPRKNVRCVIRMLEMIEKSRKMISSVPDVMINIDYLLEEEDLNFLLKRDEFEKMVEPLTTRFAQLLKDAIYESGQSTEQISAVEMIGDATRTPVILEITKQVFNKTEVLRTLNSLETIGKGASLQSAMLSPLFSVSSFIVEEYNLLPVSMTYRFAADGSAVTKEIFPKGSMFPLTKTVTFDNKTGDMDLLVHYTKGTEVLFGLPDQIAQYTIKNGKPMHSGNKLGGHKVKFQFKVINDIHQIPKLESSELIEEWNEEEKIAIKKAAAPVPPPKKTEDGKEEVKEEPKAAHQMTDQEFEIKQRKKISSYPLAYETQAHALPPNVRTQYRKLETELMTLDSQFLDVKESRNDLETYCYEFRNNLADGAIYEPHIDPKIKALFISDLNEAVEWLYGAGETAQLEELQKRFNAFKAIGDSVKKRYVYYSTVPECFKIFDNATAKIQAQLGAIEYLTEDQRKTIIGKVTFVQDFLSEVRIELDTKPKYSDSSFTLDGVNSKIDLLEAETKGIFSMPPPKKEVPKPEDAKPQEGSADVDMEDMPPMEENTDKENNNEAKMNDRTE